MKYANRYHIIKQALEGLITCEEGAKTLNISTKHFKRLKAEKATLYTNKVFIPRYNRKFAVEPEVLPSPSFRERSELLDLFRKRSYGRRPSRS